MKTLKTWRNWIIVLLIFAVPVGIFAILENGAKTTASESKIASHTKIHTNGKAKLMKFSSPLCSDCKKVSKTMVTIVPDYKDSVVFEEINVSDGSKESADAIKDYKITVVPTLIFVSKEGEIIQKTEGLMTEEEIRSTLNNIK